MEACGVKTSSFSILSNLPVGNMYWTCFAAIFALFGSLFVVVRFVKKYRADRQRLRLQGEEVSQVDSRHYGSISQSKPVTINDGVVRGPPAYGTSDPFGERSFVASENLPDQPRWFL